MVLWGSGLGVVGWAFWAGRRINMAYEKIYAWAFLVADPEGALVWTRLQTPHSCDSVGLGDYKSADLCQL